MRASEVALLQANLAAAKSRNAEPKGQALRVTLPYPPSVNAIWRSLVIAGRGRVVLAAEGKRYRQAVGRLCAAQAVSSFERGTAVAVVLTVYRPRRVGDLDNTAKAVLDALRGQLFEDDSQVIELHMFRRDDKEKPRCEVEVWRAE